MKKVLRIDNEGFFVEDIIVNDNEIVPHDCIEVICPEGFNRPKWNGRDWIEGKTPEEIAIILFEKLADEIRQLRQTECFAYTDRFLWFESLTAEQQDEIRIWRQAWLTAPETQIIPNKPIWLI